MKSSIQRQRTGPSRVDIAMIANADHMYPGEEANVARIIAGWIERVVPPGAGNGDASGKR